MSRYRKVDPRIWNDAKFRSLSDSAKLVFFMLLTHPNMTALGAMRATVSGLAEEMGWTREAFAEAFGEVLSKAMVEHDQKACLIALPKFMAYNPPESPNVVKAWCSALDLLPECDLKFQVIQRAKDFAQGLSEGFGKALPEAFDKGMPKTMPIQKQEQEQEQNNTEPKGSRAKAPSPADSIWSDGVGYLVKSGQTPKAARSFLGKMIKDHTAGNVLKAVEDAMAADPADPVPYIRKTLSASSDDFMAGAL